MEFTGVVDDASFWDSVGQVADRIQGRAPDLAPADPVTSQRRLHLSDPGVGNKTSAKSRSSSGFRQQSNAVRLPLCQKHELPCNSFTSRKQNANQGKKFWVCSVPKPGQCSFFAWDHDLPTKKGVKFAAVDDPMALNVTLLLESETAFSVDHQPFSKELVALLKAHRGRWDENLKVWIFPLSAYTAVEAAIRGLKQKLKVDAIPAPVLAAFMKQASNASSSDKATHAAASCVFDSHRIPSALWQQLHTFQREGVQYIVERDGRGFIGDEMGLGKTVQAICVMMYYEADWPALVVCPSSLRFNWQKELLTWVETLRQRDIDVVMSSSAKGSKSKSWAGGKRKVGTARITIVSYDLAQRMADELKTCDFGVVVCDESHFMKNGKAKRTQAVLPLATGAKRCLLLSGTPALNRPEELYTQANALLPQLFPVFHKFGMRYCDGQQTQFGWQYKGAQNLRELHTVMKKFVLIRRLKAEVLSQLPSKRRQAVLVDVPKHMVQGMSSRMEETRAALVESLQGDGGATPHRTALMEMFKQTGRAKIGRVLEYLGDMIEAEVKFLVFAHHLEVLDEIQQLLQKMRVRFIRIDGSTPANSRQDLVDEFQTEDDCTVALLSLTAGGTGLTLTKASTVVFAELHWTPGILIQAEDRVHRIGQEQSVNVHYILGENTLDEMMWPMISRKLEVLGNTLNGVEQKMLEPPIEAEDALEASGSHDASQRLISDMFVATSSVSQVVNPLGRGAGQYRAMVHSSDQAAGGHFHHSPGVSAAGWNGLDEPLPSEPQQAWPHPYDPISGIGSDINDGTLKRRKL